MKHKSFTYSMEYTIYATFLFCSFLFSLSFRCLCSFSFSISNNIMTLCVYNCLNERIGYRENVLLVSSENMLFFSFACVFKMLKIFRPLMWLTCPPTPKLVVANAFCTQSFLFYFIQFIFSLFLLFYM